ncbi:MAG TPA: hypothetical protein VHG51_04410 [Longimicrobiaceae bacterium]|nr:hypothetical protein [Longimicrobiaceae bacterium]
MDDGFPAGRLENARAFRAAAHTAAELAGPGENANPIVSLIVSAAIAYADALTGTLRGRVNQQDHAAARKALRDALGNRLPKSQERGFARILEAKDDAQYGATRGRLSQARELLEDLDAFAAWAEAELRRP